MKRLVILALILLCGVVQALAQPADQWDDHYDRSIPLSFFKIKNYDQIRAWSEHPGARFNIYIMPVGVNFQGKLARPSFNLDLGARINQYLYTGVETGLNLESTSFEPAGTPDFISTYVPLSLNVKGLYPIGRKVCPYVSASAGCYFGIQDIAETNGFYSNIKAGVEINRKCVSAGYSLIRLPSKFQGNFQIHLGVRLGR